MTLTIERRVSATYYWAGSFVDETETKVWADDRVTHLERALAEAPTSTYYGRPFFGLTLRAYDVVDVSEALPVGFEPARASTEIVGKPEVLGQWYFGTEYDAAGVEALSDGQDYSTLLSNMRANDWPRVCRTTSGNWKPVEDGTIILPPEQHPLFESRAENMVTA